VRYISADIFSADNFSNDYPFREIISVVFFQQHLPFLHINQIQHLALELLLKNAR
jgi:hypothetical protein